MNTRGLALYSLLLCSPAFADQIEMRNGDHYQGKVLALTNQTLVLQSDVLGVLKLPQASISTIAFGPRIAATNVVRSAASGTNPNSELSAAVRNLTTDQGATEQVKQQLLSGADPAAKAKFDSTLNDLMTGKMSMTDLQGQARSAANTIRQLKQQLGSESDPTLDGYLAVLESFLREAPAVPTAARTNSAPVKSIPGTKDDDN
jgi:hypothetical protein